MKERWKPVPGSNGAYEASTLGRIRSMPRRVTQRSRWGTPMSKFVKGGIMSPSTDKDGYSYVSTRQLGGNRRVCRLVAMAFHPNPDNKPQVNHKNGVVNDDRPDNLEWCTNSENHIHACHVLGRKPNVPPSIPVLLTSPEGVSHRFDGTTEAAAWLGVVRTAVANAVRNGTPTKGHKAQYV